MASAVQIIISAKDLASMTLRNFQGTIDRTVRSVERFASTANYVALRAGIALAGIGMGAKHLLTVASESEELDNVMQESFEHMRDSVESWAISTAQAMNRSTYQMREFVGLNQALLRPLIGDIAKATEMSKTLATLAVDMASFWNVEDKEVFEALQSGIVGLVRPLRRFGIDLTEAALKQYALNKGIKEAIEEMDQAKKALLRYDFIMERTILQQGDAIRTAGSYQNQLKGLQGDIRNLTEEMGKLLLPMGTEVLRNVRDLVKWFRDLDTETKTQIVRWAAIGSAVLGGVVAFGMVATAINVVVKSMAILSALAGVLTSPLVLGFGLLIATGALLYTAWDKDWFGLKTKILDFTDNVGDAFENLAIWWNDSQLKDALENFYNEIQKIWQDSEITLGAKVIKTVWLTVQTIGGIAESINEIWLGMSLLLTKKTVKFLGLDPEESWIVDFVEKMQEIWKQKDLNFGQKVISSLSLVVASLHIIPQAIKTELVMPTILKITKFEIKGLEWLKQKTGDISKFMEEWAQKRWEGIDLKKAFERGYNQGAEAPDFFDDYVRQLLELGKLMGEAIGKSFEIGLDLRKIFKAAVRGAFANLVEIGAEIAGAIIKGIEDFFDNFLDLPGMIWDTLKKKDLKSNVATPNQKGWGDFLRETRGYHEGGILPGKSGPDQFLAMVAPGEAIVPSKVVNAGWRAVLAWFRQKGVPGFQSGYVPNIRTGNAEFDANLRSTSDWLRNLSEGLNDIFRVIKDGFVNFFSFIGEFLIRLAEKFFPEQVKDLREFWSNLVERWNKIINAKPFEAEPGKRPEEQVIVDTRTAWQRMIDTLSADWKKVIELYNKVAIRYDILRKWLQKSWEEKLDDMKEIFAKAVLGFRDVAINVVQNLDDLIISKSPILSGIMSAKERGFEEGGTWGAVSAVVLALINHSQTLANLMGIINPLMQAFADMIGALLSPLLPLVVVISTTITPIFKVLGAILSALMPVFELLFPVFKTLGIVVLGVANTIANVWNMLVGIIDAIPFVNMSKYYIDTKGLSDAMKELSELTWEEAMARAVNTDKIKEATEAMRNVPSGFKVALRRFEATIPQGMSASSATLTNAIVNNKSEEIHIHIEGDVYGVQDLDRKIEEAIAKARRKQGLAAHGLTGAKAGAY